MSLGGQFPELTPQQQQDLQNLAEHKVKKHEDNALHIACLENKINNVKQLLRMGVPINNQSSYDGATALHRAAENGNIEIAQILLEHKADINCVNYSSQTPFHVAMERGYEDFGLWMIEAKIVKFCRQGKCTKCRMHKKLLQKRAQEREERLKEELKRTEEGKKRRKRIEKQKKEEEHLEQLDFGKCAQAIKEEIGGPFFSDEENRRYREEQRRLYQEYGQELPEFLQEQKQKQKKKNAPLIGNVGLLKDQFAKLKINEQASKSPNFEKLAGPVKSKTRAKTRKALDFEEQKVQKNNQRVPRLDSESDERKDECSDTDVIELEEQEYIQDVINNLEPEPPSTKKQKNLLG